MAEVAAPEMHRPSRGGSVRVLGRSDLPSAIRVLSANPVENVFVASRVRAAGLEQTSLGCPVWGYERDGALRALCHAGSNLVPVNADAGAIEAWTEFAGPQRTCASIIGPSPVALELWRRLSDRWGSGWGEVRNVRPHQPVMSISTPPVGPHRPAGPPGHPGPLERLHRRRGQDVHRGDRGLARAGQPRRLPVLRPPTDHLGPRLRHLRSGPGDLQGRSGVGLRLGLPGAGGLARSRAPGSRSGRARDGRGGPARPDDGADRLACTSTTTTSPPGPPTRESGSPRSASSRPFTTSSGSRPALR